MHRWKLHDCKERFLFSDTFFVDITTFYMILKRQSLHFNHFLFLILCWLLIIATFGGDFTKCLYPILLTHTGCVSLVEPVLKNVIGVIVG